MSFTNPLYLWTLLGLLIPIAIHLWSKKEGKVIKVGSIKNLKESDSKQSSSIKLNELFLLFMRLLFLALVSFILAEPYFKRTIKNTPTQYIVEPSLFLDANYISILDSLKNESTLLLVEGLPNFNEDLLENISKDAPNYWQLATQMERLKADSIVVLSYAYNKGLKGKRPEIDANVNWLVLENKNHFKSIVSATKKENDIELIALNSTSKTINFSKHTYKNDSEYLKFNATKDSILVTLENKQYVKALKDEERLTILLNSDENSANNNMFIKATLQAISEHLNITINIDELNDIDDFSKYNAIISLSNSSNIDTEKRLLIYKSDPFAKELIEQGETPNLYYLTQPLNTELSIKKHLAEQLLEFLNLNSNLNTDDYNKTQVDQLEIQPKLATKKVTFIQEKSKVSISHWLWLFAFFILILERGLAYYRKQ